jgi:hypothetical protein
MKLLIIQVSPATCYFIHFRLKYSPQHPLLKYRVYILPFTIRGQLSFPYKITDNIIVLCISICTFSDSKKFYDMIQNDSYQ